MRVCFSWPQLAHCTLTHAVCLSLSLSLCVKVATKVQSSKVKQEVLSFPKHVGTETTMPVSSRLRPILVASLLLPLTY